MVFPPRAMNLGHGLHGDDDLESHRSEKCFHSDRKFA
jgi:hypothetical protein